LKLEKPYENFEFQSSQDYLWACLENRGNRGFEKIFLQTDLKWTITQICVLPTGWGA